MTALLDPAEFRRLCEDVRLRFPLPSVAGQSLTLKRAGNEWKARCPFHSERTPSFTIFDSDRRYYCHGCGAGGDVLDFVQHIQGVGLREAVAMLDGGTVPVAAQQPTPAQSEPERDTAGEAVSIWRSAGPVRGTPAEAYLRGRGIRMQIPESIRFAKLPYGQRGNPLPCLVAVVAGSDDKIAGIQRTYVKADGSGKANVPVAKLSLGRIRGGAIRLAPAAAELVVTEGLEDALTLQQELGRAVWAAAGASMMPGMRFPAGVRSIVIGADNDSSGEEQARKAAEGWDRTGIATRIMRPDAEFKDFNDQLRGVRE